jgi:uncharacterized protein YggE
MARTVTVTGRGSASAAYDLATLALGVTARAATPADATARAGYALAQVREAVLGRGVEGSEVATGAVTLVAVHDPWPTVTGYEASFALTVRTEDLGGVGSLLVAAVAAGGDGARVDRVAFGHRDPEPLVRQARERAYADARRQAEQYAGLAEQALGEVRRVDAADRRPGETVAVTGRATRAAEAEPPIDAGTGAAMAAVTVTWALGPSG